MYIVFVSCLLMLQSLASACEDTKDLVKVAAAVVVAQQGAPTAGSSSSTSTPVQCIYATRAPSSPACFGSQAYEYSGSPKSTAGSHLYALDFPGVHYCPGNFSQ